MDAGALQIAEADPRSPEATALIAALSCELARRYDCADEGAGNFRPEDVLVPGGAFVIGRHGGAPVACGAVRPMGPGVAEVKRMFVVPALRGRRISRKLLDGLEAEARRRGFTMLRLETGFGQPEAIGPVFDKFL